MTTLTRYDYTVGWLCALPKSELVAAKQMLDYRHKPVRDLNEYDENTYTYGSINGHNIVIACLPPGQPGGASAARLVQPLSMSFPKMRVHLLVGVGGGVPRDPQPDNPDEDVRLGDVVVGWAEQTGHPAVVQYDYVRHEKGGDGELLGRLDNPHWIVLNALGALLANAYIETKFEEHLRKVCQSLEGFSRPCEDDYLYHKTYSHVSGQTCSACAPSSRVQRKARKSNHLIFHQGTILSGSSIMTDAETRDSLSKKYHDAKCFEMEAFGVMNQKHCLVIRGISDYSDSHKNQSWQKYAASTAAAFAREFLYTLQPHNASRMETMEDITSLERV